MNEKQGFPAELVEARAKELCDERNWAGAWRQVLTEDRFEGWRRAARLSLRREVEACEPLANALACVHHATERSADRAADAISAHRARYAPAPKPAPDALADVAREAADMLDAPDILGTHAQLSDARALAAKLREAAKAREVKP